VYDFFGTTQTDSLKSIIDNMGIWADKTYNKVNKVNIYNAVGSLDNYFKYSGSGKTIINSGAGDDFCLATLNKKSQLTIKDTAANDEDLLYVNANYKNVKALFNVKATEYSYSISVTENAYSNDLIIFNKGSLTASNVKNLLSGKDAKGIIDIDNFWVSKDGGLAPGTGYLDGIAVSTNFVKNMTNFTKGGYKKFYQIDTNVLVNNIGYKVAEWLNKNGKYSDSFDALQNGSKSEVNQLLKIYQGASNGAEKGLDL